MKPIINLFKSLSQFLLKGVNLSRIFLDKVSESKSDAHKIELVAKNQYSLEQKYKTETQTGYWEFQELDEAIALSDKIVNRWSLRPNLFEVILRQLFEVNSLLKKLKKQKIRLVGAAKKVAQAQNLEAASWNNPEQDEALFNAKDLYHNCYILVENPKFLQAVNRCKQQLEIHGQFNSFVKQAKELISNWKFQEGLQNLRSAEELFVTLSLQEEIAFCLGQIELQEEFEMIQKEVYNLAQMKEFQEAFDKLESILIKFPYPDGKELLAKIYQIIEGKKCFQDALIAEKQGDLAQAVDQYKKALKILPQLTECKIRLAIIAIKSHKWEEALSYVEGLTVERATYIRGFAYAQQEKWEQAEQEWSSLSDADTKSLCITLIKRQKLFKIKEIECFVDAGQFEQAKLASKSFLDIFGPDDLVKRNLDKHIQPMLSQMLEKSLWESENWQEITKKAEEIWLEYPDIISLHNWTVASYYLAQIDPNKLLDLITPWSAALANIDQDPSLQNLFWIGNNTVDLQEVFSDLKQTLDQLIDQVKDKNIEQYFQLRDHFRLEFTAIESMGNPPISGVKLNYLFLTPGCYKHFITSLLNDPSSSIEELYDGLPQESLYTAWGLAVAACLEGDVERAIKIKPQGNPRTDAEKYGYQFVCYHQGCYFLGKNLWRESVFPLQQAKPLITLSSQNSDRIDQLCEKQRKEIEDLSEHLEFSEFWYDLLQTNSSKLYFSEYKAKEVVKKIADKTMTENKGLQELRKISSICPDNPVVDDYINRISFSLELEKVLEQMQEANFREALNMTKKSPHQEKIKITLLEICLELFNKISKEVKHQEILNPRTEVSTSKLILMCNLVLFMYDLDSTTVNYQTYRDYQAMRSRLTGSHYY
jgi:tetratricopeptide (TPR) repeat protein